tara:strand:+ start:18092 stop:18244 length:153 start_codon:yes stop_codon:yes gene_type:complete
MAISHNRELIDISGQLCKTLKSFQRVTPPAEAIQGQSMKFMNLGNTGVLF